MRLDKYLKENDVHISNFAKEIGVNRTSLWRYAKGILIPRRSVAKRIEIATLGNVTAAEIMSGDYENDDGDLKDFEFSLKTPVLPGAM